MAAEGVPAPVVALAGRRIDLPGAEVPRFPLDRVPSVKAALSEAFMRHRVAELVCSASCGADLVALAAAEELRIRRRIVLPFDAAAFRCTSVIDRPGNWGPLYDRLIANARASGDLLALDGRAGDEGAYSRANYAIIREAASDSSPHLAILVWEGRTRGDSDATEEFRRLAIGAGFGELTILTC